MSARKNFPLRIDQKLYQVLEKWAADELRSINAHIEFLLREAARKAGRLPAPAGGAGGDGAGEKD
ncbi:MAG: toxin-antitoxin system HicB family antitoxin [Peptococcaceae bacterium]|nr:toxin-antitoxin system HicB family antitoxin [Peptococcaceae bacterium]